MRTIKERAIAKYCTHCGARTEYNCSADVTPCDDIKNYVEIATEQKTIDHSEEHLNWILKQHYLWSYEMCHCDNNECCTFKEWIDKAMEE